MVIQFTAAISPGSSGGALFNDQGQVIGLVYAKHKEGDRNFQKESHNDRQPSASDGPDEAGYGQSEHREGAGGP